ncbi:MAG TPA: hypothetical protein VMH28_18110 [Candidatus Acidoferrales bacterium]|nr:hypothetical protein [Candidatus Acidoferrales bacterium]
MRKHHVAAWLPALLLGPTTSFGASEGWIPVRWTGGPVEVARRAKAGSDAVRDAIANWYDPATLELLRGSPFNCLLVTWSSGAADEIERRQQEVVKAYSAEAHRRGFAVLGLIYAGADPSAFVAAAADARLDGFVLEGEFPTGFAARIPGTVVIPIEGVSPSARNLADMGIRAAPSSEPWIQSNIWLVRATRFFEPRRPVWVRYRIEGERAADYERAIADAAAAGGRWIVDLDDGLRMKLRRGDESALVTWRRIGEILRFAEDHAAWRGFLPYGKLSIVVDGTADETRDEYLKLVARRQVPYRLIARRQLSLEALAGFRAVLATELAPPTAAERKLLSAFAEGGGLVVGGPEWGEIPAGKPYVERPCGKGRMALYRSPDPEAIAREMRELLALREAGLIAFNVPTAITYASREPNGGRLLVQLVNYSDSPATDITIRVSGNFKTARLFTPGAEAVALETSAANGETDVTIPKLGLWGGVELEGETP